MNKRIQELERRAWEQVNRTNGLVHTEDFNQKFAELIVRECVRAVENGGGMCGVTSSNKIKKHFGVEE